MLFSISATYKHKLNSMKKFVYTVCITGILTLMLAAFLWVIIQTLLNER